jgi:predicted GTPase
VITSARNVNTKLLLSPFKKVQVMKRFLYVPRPVSCQFLRRFSSEVEITASELAPSETETTERHNLPDFTPLSTNIPTIFACTPVDPVVDLVHITAKAVQLFKRGARYVHPKEFDFDLPDDALPEFAFVGRSNVGKSSLVGNILGDHTLGM